MSALESPAVIVVQVDGLNERADEFSVCFSSLLLDVLVWVSNVFPFSGCDCVTCGTGGLSSRLVWFVGLGFLDRWMIEISSDLIASTL